MRLGYSIEIRFTSREMAVLRRLHLDGRAYAAGEDEELPGVHLRKPFYLKPSEVERLLLLGVVREIARGPGLGYELNEHWVPHLKRHLQRKTPYPE